MKSDGLCVAGFYGDTIEGDELADREAHPADAGAR